MAQDTVGEEQWATLDGVRRLRVIAGLGFGEVHDRFAVLTPGGTLTADAETNVLREVVEEYEPEEQEGPIPLDALGREVGAGRHVVQDLVPEGQLVTIVGEEGEGKSTLGWQIACEASSGKPVGGRFDVPEPVAPVLIVDVEQTEEDAVILRNVMVEP